MFLVLDQDSNFKLKGYNDAVAAKSRAYYDLFEGKQSSISIYTLIKLQSLFN